MNLFRRTCDIPGIYAAALRPDAKQGSDIRALIGAAFKVVLRPDLEPTFHALLDAANTEIPAAADQMVRAMLEIHLPYLVSVGETVICMMASGDRVNVTTIIRGAIAEYVLRASPPEGEFAGPNDRGIGVECHIFDGNGATWIRGDEALCNRVVHLAAMVGVAVNVAVTDPTKFTIRALPRRFHRAFRTGITMANDTVCFVLDAPVAPKARSKTAQAILYAMETMGVAAVDGRLVMVQK